MMLAHRIRLSPNNVQATGLSKAAGVARFAYNWALEEWQRQYELSKTNAALPKPHEAAIRRQLNATKRSTFPWMLEVTKNAPQMAIMQLGQAFENFFAGRTHYPTFRKKGRDDRFTITNDQFMVDDKRIRIPKLGLGTHARIIALCRPYRLCDNFPPCRPLVCQHHRGHA